MRNAWLAWGMLAGKHFLDLSCKLLAATCMQRVHLSVVFRTMSRTSLHVPKSFEGICTSAPLRE